MTTNLMIRAADVHKRFGTVEVLKGVRWTLTRVK